MSDGSKTNIYQKVLKVSECAPRISKDTTIKQGYSSYQAVSHDGVISAIRPLLVQHGLTLIPSVVSHSLEIKEVDLGKGPRLLYLTKIEVSVVVVNVDKPEETIQTLSWGYGQDYGDKGVGKAYSYAVKYAILKLFNLETGDNDEERVEQPMSSSTAPKRVPNVQQSMDGVQGNKFVMPFGSDKGKSFKDIDHDKLLSAKAWCIEKGKFDNLVEEIDEFLGMNKF